MLVIVGNKAKSFVAVAACGVGLGGELKAKFVWNAADVGRLTALSRTSECLLTPSADWNQRLLVVVVGGGGGRGDERGGE